MEASYSFHISSVPTPESRKQKASAPESPQTNGAPLGDETSAAVNGTAATPPAGGLDEETRLKNLQKLAMRGKKKTPGGDNRLEQGLTFPA